jgi:hypothetical protein
MLSGIRLEASDNGLNVQATGLKLSVRRAVRDVAIETRARSSFLLRRSRRWPSRSSR